MSYLNKVVLVKNNTTDDTTTCILVTNEYEDYLTGTGSLIPDEYCFEPRHIIKEVSASELKSVLQEEHSRNEKEKSDRNIIKKFRHTLIEELAQGHGKKKDKKEKEKIANTMRGKKP